MMSEPERSLAMMKDPYQWPLIVLPVKKKNGPLGVMFGPEPRVYTVSMWELAKYKTAKPDDIPHQDYLDLEGVVDDGWVVD